MKLIPTLFFFQNKDSRPGQKYFLCVAVIWSLFICIKTVAQKIYYVDDQLMSLVSSYNEREKWYDI